MKGIKAYDKLYEAVKKDRDKRPNVDVQYFQERKQNLGEKVAGKRKRIELREQGWEEAKEDDLSVGDEVVEPIEEDDGSPDVANGQETY